MSSSAASSKSLKRPASAPKSGRSSKKVAPPTYVYIVTFEQKEHCCGQEGLVHHGVFATAKLARAAARKVLWEGDNSEAVSEALGFETFRDSGKYDTQGRKALIADCVRRGVDCGVVEDETGLSSRDLRARLEQKDSAERVESVRAKALAEGENPDEAEGDLEDLMNQEYCDRLNSAVEYFLSGALDAGKFFSDDHGVFEEFWDGEDSGGRIKVPEGGSCCWGSVSATIRVVRSELHTHSPVAGKKGGK